MDEDKSKKNKIIKLDKFIIDITDILTGVYTKLGENLNEEVIKNGYLKTTIKFIIRFFFAITIAILVCKLF